MPGTRKRAAIELGQAAKSPCGACGRETKTVEGVCAECWEAKEPGARVMRREPRRTPLLDFDVDLLVAYRTAATAVGLLIVLVVGLWAGR